jgi:hypothetical protein
MTPMTFLKTEYRGGPYDGRIQRGVAGAGVGKKIVLISDNEITGKRDYYLYEVSLNKNENDKYPILAQLVDVKDETNFVIHDDEYLEEDGD